MKKSALLLLSMVLLLSMLLAACGGKEADKETKPATPTEENKPAENVGEPKPGGTVTYAFSSPFQGLLDKGFYKGEDDNGILNFMMDGLFKTGDDLKTYPNIADWKVSDDHKVFTFTIKKGVKWHNGDELTVEDWKYALEVIANKDYTGARYEDNVSMIQGADEYHKGKADSISGIKVIDPYTIEMTMKEARVNTLDNLWSYPMPKKYYEGIAIKDLQDSPKIRKNPIGLGPFKVKKIQPGEFVQLERFDDYWQGKPYLDGVVYKVTDDKLTTSLLQKGEIDIIKLTPSQYEETKKLDNVNLKVEDALSFQYIGFKFGHYDAKQEKNVMDKPKFAEKKLRQAMYYALDRQGLIDAFASGLGNPLAAPMPKVSWAKIADDQLNPYAYDPEKAKQLLDEAGYKDVNGDGLREDPQGKKFTINFDAMSGLDIAEPRAQAIMQMWKEVGLDVKLNGGGLKEFNMFYEDVQKDAPSMEVFMAAWGMSSDPDPTGLWKSTAMWNFPRWVNEQSDKLIEEGLGEKSFDIEHRKQVYYDWQKLLNEEVPMLFLYSPQDVYAMNKRLQGVHTNADNAQEDSYKWWVTN